MLALRGITLQDNAIIRFFSVGNNAVGIMRLSDGTPIPATPITLSSRASYWFSDPINGSTGSRRSFHAAQRAVTDDALQAD